MFPLIVTMGQKIGAGVPGTSYGNTGGTGDRTATITVTSNKCMNQGTDSNLVDGAFGTNSTDSRDFHALCTGCIIQWDFGSGNSNIIDEMKWYSSGTDTHSTWVVEASADAIHWIVMKASFTLGGSSGANTISWTNASGSYRYWRLRQTDDATTVSSSPWDEEIEFKLAAFTGSTPATNVQSYGSRGGCGDRTSVITITTTATMGGGSTIDKLINGSAFRVGLDNATDACFWNGGQSTREVKFDFGASYSPIITEFTWYQDGVANHGTWKIAGSNDDSSYTDILTGLTLGGATRTAYAMTNSTAYRYYKLIQTAGTTSSSPWLREIWFKLASA